MAQLLKSCRTAEEVRELFGLRGGEERDSLNGALKTSLLLGGAGLAPRRFGRTLSAVERAAGMELAFRSDCLVEGTERALVVRRAFAAVLVDQSEGSPAACLSQDLVEEVCLATGAGWIDSGPELREECEEGGNRDGGFKLGCDACICQKCRRRPRCTRRTRDLCDACFYV